MLAWVFQPFNFEGYSRNTLCTLNQFDIYFFITYLYIQHKSLMHRCGNLFVLNSSHHHIWLILIFKLFQKVFRVSQYPHLTDATTWLNLVPVYDCRPWTFIFCIKLQHYIAGSATYSFLFFNKTDIYFISLRFWIRSAYSFCVKLA
jgi:hypothetical protein